MTALDLTRLLTLGFVAIVVALHVLRRDVSPIQRGISRYASGRTTSLMTIAFLALAAAIGIVSLTTRSWPLALAASAMAGVAARPDRKAAPAHDLVHAVFGATFFIAAAAGIYTSPHSSPWPAVATAIFFLALARVPGLSRIPGLLQRLCFLTIVIWLLSPFHVRS